MKTTLFFIALLLSCLNTAAQKFAYDAGAASAAIADASVCREDFWSLQNNQAGLGLVKNISAGIAYKNRFLIKELSTRFIGIVVPTSTGNFGLSFQQFGYALYSESMIGLAFGKALSDKFSTGLRIDYLSNSFGEGYGNKSWISFEIGILYRFSEKLNIGSHLAHPMQQKTAEFPEEKLPVNFKFGLSYFFSDDLNFCFESEKNSHLPLNLKCGLEYEINKLCSGRIGLSSKPASLSFGGGLHWKNFQLDVASAYHQVLGFSPEISVEYRFKK